MTLHGASILITGASSGLGRSLALELASAGARLALMSRNEEALRETVRLAEARGAECVAVPGDVTREGDCARCVGQTEERFSALDAIIANAGLSMWARFEDLADMGVLRALMDTNYFGTVHMVRAALPALRRSGGLIVAISSLQGRIGVTYHTGYSASKHAVRGFLDALRFELRGSGVNILMVSPHWLRGTNLRENALGADGGRIGEERRAHTRESVTLDDCSRRIVGAMRKRKRELVIPGRIRLLFLAHLVAPRLAERIIRRKIDEQK